MQLQIIQLAPQSENYLTSSDIRSWQFLIEIHGFFPQSPQVSRNNFIGGLGFVRGWLWDSPPSSLTQIRLRFQIHSNLSASPRTQGVDGKKTHVSPGFKTYMAIATPIKRWFKTYLGMIFSKFYSMRSVASNFKMGGIVEYMYRIHFFVWNSKVTLHLGESRWFCFRAWMEPLYKSKMHIIDQFYPNRSSHTLRKKHVHSRFIANLTEETLDRASQKNIWFSYPMGFSLKGFFGRTTISLSDHDPSRWA